MKLLAIRSSIVLCPSLMGMYKIDDEPSFCLVGSLHVEEEEDHIRLSSNNLRSTVINMG